jgi:exodeoxyribonuclease-3
MRVVAWNCNMALHRKLDALKRLAPDVAIVSECADPARLRLQGALGPGEADPIWIGDNPHKGLAVFAFNGYRARLAPAFHASLRYVLPVQISGPVEASLLAVWAQNLSGGITRKRQKGPLRRALGLYRDFLSAGPALVAGDLNNNVIWHKPGYLINHANAVAELEAYGLVSAYHTHRGERQGEETTPTLYWRDRKKDGPTYHIDYIFIPRDWIACVRGLSVGSFEEWCGSGLSDHVPVLVDVGLGPAPPRQARPPLT